MMVSRFAIAMTGMAAILALGLPSQAMGAAHVRAQPATSRSLRSALRNPVGRIHRLMTGHDRIARVGENINVGGRSVLGVWKIEEGSRPLALRILKKGQGLTSPELINEILVQQAFASHGVAPKIHFVLDAAEVAALARKHPELARQFAGQEPGPAVAMDLIDQAWAPKYQDESPFPPEIVRTWRPQAYRARLARIREVAARLKVNPGDCQLLVGRDGLPQLVDFEAYVAGPPSGAVLEAFDLTLQRTERRLDSAVSVAGGGPPLPWRNPMHDE
jgi:hypothetical protein